MWTLLQRREELRYIGSIQTNRYHPEVRARVCAKYNWWFHFQENKSLPFALHFSFFLFMAGVLIYFFNVNHATFGAVAWWILYTSVEHVVATIMPIFQRDALFYTPLFSFPFELYLRFLRFISQVCSWIKPGNYLDKSIWRYQYNLRQNYGEGFVGTKAKSIEETALEPSWDVDTEILGHILLVVDSDDELERFFDGIPGFCNSELVKRPLHPWTTTKLQQAMDGFLDRTFSSHLVPESVRNDRLISCLNAGHSALEPQEFSAMLGNFFNGRRNEALKSIEIGHSLSCWGNSNDYLISADLRKIIARIIVCAEDRDDRWRILVEEAYGVPDGVFRDYVAHGDSALLAILIYVARDYFRAVRWAPGGVLDFLSRFGMNNTVPELQHDFCTLWDEIVREARTQGFGSIPTRILAEIRYAFATLHPGTDVASFQAHPAVLSWSAWYPLCNDPSHRPHSATHGPPGTSSAVSPYTRLRTQNHSEPAIVVSTVQRTQSSRRPRRTRSCHQFPTMPVTEPSDALNLSPHIASASQLSQSASPDLATDNINVTPDNADISDMSNTSDPICGAGTIPPLVAFGPLPTPIPTPALSRSSNSTVLLPPSVARSNCILHTPGLIFPSPTSTPAPLPVAPPATTASPADQYLGVHHGIGSVQDNIQDSCSPIPREDHDQSPPGDATGF